MYRLIYPVICLSLLFIMNSVNANDSHYPGGASLPAPSSIPIQDYEKKLYRWLMTRQYKKLNWRRDKTVRDTGPFINSVYYGTHPAVRIFYSPEVIAWLENNREGELPDGSIIVKEMFMPPAVFYQDMAHNPKYKNPQDYNDFIDSMVFSWTVMVRDKTASKDGWFWANPGAPKENESIRAAIKRQLDTLQSPPASEFGAPCLRCHASASHQSTFSDLKNILGFSTDEEPLRFLVDTSWRTSSHFSQFPLSLVKDDPYVKQHFILPDSLLPYNSAHSKEAKMNGQHMAANKQQSISKKEALQTPNQAFLKTFTQVKLQKEKDVAVFPSQWMDQVLPQSHKAQAFMTSDNCLGCHGGLGGEPYGVTMFVKTGPNYGDGYNLSEYGEWRWSPMGVAGRDPIFHAQLESEMALLALDERRIPSPLKASLSETRYAVTNTCLSCHGAMGQRQLSIDAANDPTLDANFKVEYFYLKERLSKREKKQKHERYIKYGQLAREGVSCAICHHIDSPSAKAIEQWTPPYQWINANTDKNLAYMLFHNNTGRYVQGPNDEFFGPFKEVAEKPMQHTLGVKPVFHDFISDSQLCGTCHTINLPNIGAKTDEFPILTASETNPVFKDYPHSIEQATFLEWQNSAFANNNGGKNSRFKSCQDCHMPGGFETLDKSVSIKQITTQIAAIQDVNFPEADNRLPNHDINIPLRSNYRRHEHVGLNVFLLEMFDQFPQILGVDKNDYMTSADNGVDTAIENMIRQAQQESVTIDLKINSFSRSKVNATVEVKNLAGHRFPSGVAFRRAFIEFTVLDGDREIWVSGKTNSVGVILDGDGQPLKTEFLPNRDSFQPHYQKISQQDQVQIYEELTQNAQHEFTTSFIHRVFSIKDNRLLPDGWRAANYFKKDGEVLYEFFQATDPHATGDDPDYMDQGPNFKGKDSLVYDVTLPENSGNLNVRATLYYQAIPPYWLKQRFTDAPDGLATKRLYFMASYLDLEGTPMEDWKLKLVSTSKNITLEK